MTRTVQNTDVAGEVAGADRNVANQQAASVLSRTRVNRKFRRLMWLACLGPICFPLGCSVLKRTHETIRTEHLYSRSNKDIEKQMELWAEESWLSHCGPDKMLLEDKHFQKGFQAGFVRYLRTGSTDEPLFPPQEYLKGKYVSVEGRDALNRWISGYELGTAAATQGSYRELVKIPVLGVRAPDDNNMPVAQSVVVDSIVDCPGQMYEPIQPLPLPPSLPTDDQLEPLPPWHQDSPTEELPTEEIPAEKNPADVQSTNTTSADPDFDAFGEGFNAPATLPPVPSAGWDDDVTTNDAAPSNVDAAASMGAPTSQPDQPLPSNEAFDSITWDEPSQDQTTAEVSQPAADQESAPQSTTSDLSFQWLDSLPAEETLQDAATREEEASASWERTQDAIPPSLEEGSRQAPPTPPSADELWLHPPEATPTDGDRFQFPASDITPVVFDEPKPEPTLEIQEPLPTTGETSEAARRRTALYAQIAKASKRRQDHIDQCAQPSNELDVNDNAPWPQLDKIMQWSNSE